MHILTGGHFECIFLGNCLATGASAEFYVLTGPLPRLTVLPNSPSLSFLWASVVNIFYNGRIIIRKLTFWITVIMIVFIKKNAIFSIQFRKLRNNLCLKTQLMFVPFALVIIFDKLNSHVILWWAQTCKAVGSDRGVRGKVASYFCSLSGNFWSSLGDSLESRGLLSMKWTRCSDVFR